MKHNDFLCIGDVLLLKSTATTETASYTVLLSADGVLSTYVEAIPKVSSDVLVRGANVLTRSCLFSVEAARTGPAETAELDVGRPLTYGAIVQLKHCHSSGYLGVRAGEIALEQGCLRVDILHEPGEAAWLQLLPCSKLRDLGEKVKYADLISLRAAGLDTTYFLHTPRVSPSPTSKLEVNCSPSMHEWKPQRFMDHSETTEHRFVTIGSAFRIYHRITEGYLAAAEIPLVGEDTKPPVFVAREKSCTSLWELQKLSAFRGGKVAWEDRFRLKHVASCLFLSDTGVLVMDGASPSTHFLMERDAGDSSEYLAYGAIICFQGVALGTYLSVEEPEASSHFSAEDRQFQVSWAQDKKNYPCLAFCIEQVVSAQTDHVHQLVLVTPAIIDFFAYVDVVTAAESLKTAGGVARMVEECKEMEAVLGSLSQHVIHKSDAEVDVYTRQDSLREMGIVEALLELGKAIEVLTSSLQLQASSRVLAEDKDALVKACFEPVEKRLFKVLHESIKGNEQSCIRIHHYEDYLMAKMHVPEVGQLLKEVFKFTQTHQNVDEARFERWFRRDDRPDADLSIQEMILNLHILASLCESAGKGVPKYQMMAYKYVIEAKNEFPLLKFLFIAKKPCVELIFKSDKHAQAFLVCDPQLTAFEQPRLRQTLTTKAAGQCCFFLEDLCKVPLVVKFLAAELELLVNLCLGRNTRLVSVLTKELTLAPEHAEAVLAALFLPDKIRAAYARLYLVVFVDVDPYYSCREDQSRCFQFEEGNLVKAKTRFNESRESEFEGICRIVRKFWFHEGMMSLDGQHLGQKLELTTSFLRLTRALVELDMDIGEEKPRFIEVLMQPLSLLLMERAPSLHGELTRHWCWHLMQEVHDARLASFKISLEHKWSQVILEVLIMLEVVLKHRQDLHVGLFLRLFKQLLVDGGENLDWRTVFPKAAQESAEILQRLDFDVKFERGETEVEHETGVLALDIYLLHLVFNIGKSPNKQIRKKALDLIIQNMSEKKRLKEQLAEVQFLVGSQTTSRFQHMLDLRDALRARVTLLQEEKWLSEEMKDKDRGLQAVQELVAAISEAIKQLTVPEECKTLRTKLQDLMRHSNLHQELINILYIDYELAKHSLLFERTFDALRLFILNNRQNQSLMFAHKSRLLALMEFQEGGVTHLLTEVLRSYRDTEFGLEVIRYLFLLIEKQDEYPYKLVQLLRTFTVDEAGVYIKNIQIDILKGLVNSGKVAQLHQQKQGAVVYTQPQYDKSSPYAYLTLRFHVEIIRTLIACTYTNRFGLLQCRKLISMTTLKKAIRHDTNFVCKKVYLRYLHQVYMTSLEPDVSAVVTSEDIEDLLRETALRDLEEYPRRFLELFKLGRVGAYENIKVRLSESKAKQLLDLSDPLGDEERNALEYWNYLSGRETIHTEKDGLLHIMRDIFSETESNSNEVTTVAFEISKVLRTLAKDLAEAEETYKDLDLSNLQLVVNSCREVLPQATDPASRRRQHHISEENSDSEETEEMAKLVGIIREYVISKNISFERAFDLFDVNRDGSITIAELKNVLRGLMQGNVREIELDRAVRYLDADGDGSIQFEEFTNKLKKHISRPKQGKTSFKDLNLELLPGLKEKLSDDQLQDLQLKESLGGFNEELGGMFTDVDIQPLINKVYKEFIEPSLKTKDFTIFRDFIAKMSTSFHKRAHRLYLLHMLRLLVVSAGSPDSMRAVQDLLCEASGLSVALKFLADSADLELANEAMELMLALLRGGNSLVQEALLALLQEEADAKLFSYIRVQLRMSRGRIVARANKKYESEPAVASLEMISEVDVHSEALVCEELSKLETQQCAHTLNLLLLVQSCCQGCFTPFQNYFRLQSSQTARQVSIGIVSELAQYLINLKEVGRQLRNDQEAAQSVLLCLQTLVELCKGPCLENQQLLGTKKKLYQFLNFYLSIDLNKTFAGELTERKTAELAYFAGSVRLLKALLEGEFDIKVAEMMLSVIDFRSLAHQSTVIYSLFVHSRLQYILQDRRYDEVIISRTMRFLLRISGSSYQLSAHDLEVIDLGFDVCIIILKLRQRFPDESLKWLNFSDKVPHSSAVLDKSFFLSRIEAFKLRTESVLTGGIYLYHQVRDFLRRSEEKYAASDLAYSFYLSLIGTVEVDCGGKLFQCYFRIPTMVAFMSTKIMASLTQDINRNSHDEKIKSFFQSSKKYEVAMEHLQHLSRVRGVGLVAAKRPFLETVCYLMIVAFNVIMLYGLSSTDKAEDGIGSVGSTAFLTVFAVIISILAITVYLLYVFENYPMVMYDKENPAPGSVAYTDKSLSKLKGSVLLEEIAQYSSITRPAKSFPHWKKLIYISTYYENIYNLGYVFISFLALSNPLYYAILLLDIVRKSNTLAQLLWMLRDKWRPLVLGLVFTVVLIYLFSVAGFLWLGDYFRPVGDTADRSTACSSLAECFASVLDEGVRAGGGLSSVLGYASRDAKSFWARQVFTFLFYMAVCTFALFLILGLIIDSFAQYREQQKFLNNDMKTLCFICGRHLYDFEFKGSGWNEHILTEHNLYAYLSFIIYARRKAPADCDGLEKYVQQQIEKGDVSFFPKTAKSLEHSK